MATQYSAIPDHPLPPGATLLRRGDAAIEKVAADSHALSVMTDFSHVDAVRVAPNVPIDVALDQMKTAGVRLLFVTGAGDDLLGVITSRDIEGEKPMLFQREVGVTRAEVLVRDIMTPRDSLEVLRLDDVKKARVGDVVTTMRIMGRQHAIVVEAVGKTTRIRGLFSTTRISRQLGVTLEIGEIAHTFAQIEAVLRA